MPTWGIYSDMTQLTDDVLWQRIAASLDGSLPGDEEQELRAWIEADPAREALVRTVRQIWATTAQTRQQPDVEVALAAIKWERDQRLHQALAERRRRVRRLGLAAAASTVLTVGGWLGVQGMRRSPPLPRAAAFNEYATPRGQRATFHLPDGTDVLLGPESRLRYAADYGSRERHVLLDGDAQFTVMHDSAHPFAVIASDAIVRDLGTRFVARARIGEPVVVAVAEGVVSLASSAQPDTVALHAGEIGRVPPAAAPVVDRGVAIDDYFAWTENRLVFTDARLGEVVVELRRWYGVDIQLASAPLNARRITAAFDNEPVDPVLSSIAASFGLTLRQESERYVLSAN